MRKFFGIIKYDLSHLKTFFIITLAAVLGINACLVIVAGCFSAGNATSWMMIVSEYLSRLAVLLVALSVTVNAFLKELKHPDYFCASPVSPATRIIARLAGVFLCSAAASAACLLASSVFATYAYSICPYEATAAGKINFVFCVYGKKLYYYLLPLAAGIISATVFSLSSVVAAFTKTQKLPSPFGAIAGVAVSAAIAAACYLCLVGALNILTFSAFGDGLGNLFPKNALYSLFCGNRYFIDGRQAYPASLPSYILFYNLQNPLVSLVLALINYISLSISSFVGAGRRKGARIPAFAICVIAICGAITLFSTLDTVILIGRPMMETGIKDPVIKTVLLYDGEEYDFFEDIKVWDKYNSFYSVTVESAGGKGYASGYKFYASGEGVYTVKAYLFRGGFFGGERVFGKIAEYRFTVEPRTYGEGE